jgi:hypothetical protein
MLAPLLLGSFTLLACMAIQLWVVLLLLRWGAKRSLAQRQVVSFGTEFLILGCVLSSLFLGHMAQVAIWALLFISLGEFSDFATAFYHSAVNFSTLGYGDIVMSERWRLLGALEAGSGVFMFGLSTGAILSMLNQFIVRRRNSLWPDQETD